MDRLNLSDAIDLVIQMLSRYPNGGAQAGKAYIGSLAATLCAYPKSVASACADLMTGVTSTNEFLPTPACIIAWCEPHKLDMKEAIDRDERIAAQLEERARLEQACGYRPLPAAQRANILVGLHCPQYTDMVERARAELDAVVRDKAGLWVPEAWLTGARFVGVIG